MPRKKNFDCFVRSHAKAGLVVIGQTTISIPTEHWLHLGRPRFIFVRANGKDVYIFPGDGSEKGARVISERKGRARYYAHLRYDERTWIRQDAYKPRATYEKPMDLSALKLIDANRHRDW